MKWCHLVGQRFGRLTVLEKTNERLGERKHHVVWKCQCDCGNIAYVTTSNLNHGNTKSCGCLRREVVSERRRKK